MTHVELKTSSAGTSLVVDGVEITPHVLHEGFSITPAEDGKLLVSLTIAADAVDADLPNAIVQALQATEVAL